MRQVSGWKLAGVAFGAMLAMGALRPSLAQQAVTNPCVQIPQQAANGYPNCQQVSQAAPLPVGPGQVTGLGTLSATNASTLLSTLTLGPNSAAWPTTPGLVHIWNSTGSAGVLYICPLGGTCSASNGIPVAAGVQPPIELMHPSTNMTVFAASTATVVAQW